jgi:hypothetical protein
VAAVVMEDCGGYFYVGAMKMNLRTVDEAITWLMQQEHGKLEVEHNDGEWAVRVSVEAIVHQNLARCQKMAALPDVSLSKLPLTSCLIVEACNELYEAMK